MPDDQKAAALDALKRGVLTMADIAERLGRSRSTILRWAREAGLDVERARRDQADKEWRRSIARSQGRIRRSPSKRELSAVAGQAMRRGDE